MSYNHPSSDPLQRRDERKYELLMAAHREEPKHVNTKGLVYDKIDESEIYYPAGFYMGGERIQQLNRTLLHQFKDLATCITRHNFEVAVLKDNEVRILDSQVALHKERVARAEIHCHMLFYPIVKLTSEVGAIAGRGSYHIPKALEKSFVGKLAFFVESGSLAYLADPPYYIPEVCNVGQGICIDDGSANKKKKDLIELLAFQVNRIRYFTECRLKAAEVHRNAIDRALSGLIFKLRSEFDAVMSSEGELTMSPDLSEEAQRILKEEDDRIEALKKRREEM